jgi:hypothetical protein
VILDEPSLEGTSFEECRRGLRKGGGMRHGWVKIAIILLSTLSLVGCDQSDGMVEVNPGSVPLAAAYRVDLYAQDDGLPLIEGKSVVDGSLVTFDAVPQGRWSVLVQAENGDQTTIAHFIGQIEVKANETTHLDAGTYSPGLPGDAAPESENTVESFGPEGSALLTTIYAPASDGVPAADVSIDIVSGQGQADSVEGATALAKAASAEVHRCATTWLATQPAPQVHSQSTATLNQAPDRGSLAPGQTASFFIATSFKTVECARVLNDSQTEHCLIFAELVDGTPVIDDATALEVANAFDNDNPFKDGDTGIYEDTRGRFGSEWNSNPEGGRDQDQRVVFVFLSSESIGGEGFFGFFRPQDEADTTQVENSNQGEMIFVNADRTNDDLYDALSTISHEFTHVIVWNEKVGQDGTFPEGAIPLNATLDEGLAVLNEDLSGFTYTGTDGGNFFLLSAVDGLLKEGLNRPFFQFQGGLDDYGAGYLFWRYMHDRFGEDTLREITTSAGVGRENISTIVQLPFSEVFGDFVQAVALNGEEGLPEELSFNGVDLHATYTDREGTSFPLDGLQGINQVTLPGTLQETATIEPWGTVFYRALDGDGSPLSFKATGVDSLLTQIYTSGADTTPDDAETPGDDATPGDDQTP